MKKNERGSFYVSCDGNIKFVRWNDNSAVTVGSNAYGVQPIASAKRWIKGRGKHNVPNYSLVFKKLNHLIPLSTKVDCTKNPTSTQNFG